jgi:hypothetical protein
MIEPDKFRWGYVRSSELSTSVSGSEESADILVQEFGIGGVASISFQ